MKKIFALGVVTAVVLAASLFAPMDVLAATNPFTDVCANGGGGSPACQANGGNDPIAGQNGAIVAVTSILAAVAGVVSVIFLVWGGFKYITSNGDSSGVSSAKSTIMAALIGLVIAAMARPIVMFVVSKL